MATQLAARSSDTVRLAAMDRNGRLEPVNTRVDALFNAGVDPTAETVTTL